MKRKFKQDQLMRRINRGEQMINNYEYMIVYRTPEGRRAGIYRGMDQERLKKVICSLQENGNIVETVEIVRRIGI